MGCENIYTGIDHPALAVADVATIVEWCCRVVGYTVFFKDEEKNVSILKAPDGTLLEVMPKDETSRPDRTVCTPGFSHLALRVSNLDDAIAHLEAQNVKWTNEISPAIGGGRLRNFEDPEGNLWQVVERS